MTNPTPLFETVPETWSGTGHRPNKLGGYDTHPALVKFATGVLIEIQAKRIISGMALGWDQAIAEACVALGIPFVAAVPCDGQESRWNVESKKRWSRLIGLAEQVVVVSPGPFHPWKMQRRNQWMVDRADAVLALWNKDKFGGTFNCVTYAEARKVPIKNVWEDWVRFNERAS